MLVANITDDKKTVKAEGNLIKLSADVSFLIASIYQQLDDKRGGNMKRELFRKALIRFLTDENSPIFVPMEEQIENADEGEAE